MCFKILISLGIQIVQIKPNLDMKFLISMLSVLLFLFLNKIKAAIFKLRQRYLTAV